MKEEIHLQVALDTTAVIYILIPIIIGTAGGYVIGGQRSLRPVDRVLYGIILSVIGGIMVGLVIAGFVPPEQYSFFLAVLAFAGGCVLGMIVNWEPTFKKARERHIVFDPEEDDKEFDRQIEEAFRGSDN